MPTPALRRPDKNWCGGRIGLRRAVSFLLIKTRAPCSARTGIGDLLQLDGGGRFNLWSQFFSRFSCRVSFHVKLVFGVPIVRTRRVCSQQGNGDGKHPIDNRCAWPPRSPCQAVRSVPVGGGGVGRWAWGTYSEGQDQLCLQTHKVLIVFCAAKTFALEKFGFQPVLPTRSNLKVKLIEHVFSHHQCAQHRPFLIRVISPLQSSSGCQHARRVCSLSGFACRKQFVA